MITFHKKHLQEFSNLSSVANMASNLEGQNQVTRQSSELRTNFG